MADMRSTAITPFAPTAAPVGFKSAVRKTPFRKKDPVSDVITPLAQSVVTGLMVTISGSFLAALNGWQWYSGLCWPGLLLPAWPGWCCCMLAIQCYGFLRK
jgi:hypothetical protein